MTIKFVIEDHNLYLLYSPIDDNRWVFEKFRKEEPLVIRNTFSFTAKDLKPSTSVFDGDTLKFLLGAKDGKYFSISKNVLNTKRDIMIDANILVQKQTYAGISKPFSGLFSSIEKMLISHNNISVFSKIDALCDEAIIIGGDKPEAIPAEVFAFLINKFPTKTELDHYQRSRITNILQEYFTSMTDGEKKLQEFFKRKDKRLKKLSFVKNKAVDIPYELYEYEIQKYQAILKIIEDELSKPASKTYSETDWQNLIVGILPLIFPQYVAVLREVNIKERYSKPTPTNRKIDFVLVNANGYIDILEIKKPFESCILRNELYRDNCIPKKELSGAIMQTEKYIYYLNSLSKKEEEELTKKYQDRDQLPSSLSLKIRNPKALILLGRSNHFTGKQQTDFEFIKRKYVNITDVLTYDDLLNRIKNIIYSLQRKHPN